LTPFRKIRSDLPAMLTCQQRVGWANERKRRAHHPSPIVSPDGGHASLCSPCALRTDLLSRASATSYGGLRPIGTTGKSLKPVQSSLQKYSAFVLTQIIGITPLVSRQMRDARERHERAVRCDGRGWRARRTRWKRTVKSCGSGAAVLALRWREASRRYRWQESRSPGRARSKP
jgi:hypothetical protein